MPLTRMTALSLAAPWLLLANPASAAIEGWYYGISGGQAQADLSQADLDAFGDFFFDDVGAPLLSSSSTLEDSDTAWSLLFGYQFSPYFAVEGGYIDFGSYPFTLSGTAAVTTGTAPAGFGFEFETKGFPVAAVGVLPLGYLFELQGRAGIFFSDTDATLTASLGNESIVSTLNGTATDFFYGVGLSMNLGDTWSIRADWQQFKDVGDEDVTTETDIDMISLSLIYRLGPF